MQSRSTYLCPKLIQSLQQIWPDLPIHEEPFFVSRNDAKSIQQLLNTLKNECERIMDSSTVSIPHQYLLLLEKLQQEQQLLIHANDLQTYFSKQFDLSLALRYLHSVGDIVFLPDGLICTRPVEISHIMAQFISPEYVQAALPHRINGHVEVLTSDQVGNVLSLKCDDPRYKYPQREGGFAISSIINNNRKEIIE